MRNPKTAFAASLAIASLLYAATPTSAFTAYSRKTSIAASSISITTPSNLYVHSPDSDNDGETTTTTTTSTYNNVEGRTIDRRAAMNQSISSVLGGISALSLPMGAVAYTQEKTDKENVVKGYKRYVDGVCLCACAQASPIMFVCYTS